MLVDKEFLFDRDHDGEPVMLTYSGEIDEDMIAVLKETATDDFYCTKIAEKLKICPKYVELILHCLCSLDLCEYGTSPRGSWITDTGKKYLEFIKSER